MDASLGGVVGEILAEVLSNFTLSDGLVYESAVNAEYPLTDAMLARMFPDDGDTEDLFCLASAAVYFSKRFSEIDLTGVPVIAWMSLLTVN